MKIDKKKKRRKRTENKIVHTVFYIVENEIMVSHSKMWCNDFKRFNILANYK